AALSAFSAAAHASSMSGCEPSRGSVSNRKNHQPNHAPTYISRNNSGSQYSCRPGNGESRSVSRWYRRLIAYSAIVRQTTMTTCRIHSRTKTTLRDVSQLKKRVNMKLLVDHTRRASFAVRARG